MRNKIKFALLPVVSRAFIWSAHRFYERKPFHDCMGLNSFQLTEEFLVPSLVRVTLPFSPLTFLFCIFLCEEVDACILMSMIAL
jgi:hypothetical protein